MQREQDYLVSQPGGQQNEDTQQSYRLAGGPSFGVSSTGGQIRPASNFQNAQQATPDRSRQTFRTRERQIREVRPVDFTVSQAEPTKRLIESDIRGQANRITQDLAESAPKVEEFLPDYQKALSGDQEAIRRTGERLQTPFEAREVPQIYSTEGQSLLDFLRAPSQDTFQTELSRQRGGPFGVNALDAARLAASGLGGSAFTQASRDIGQVYNLIPAIERDIRAKEAGREADYGSRVAELLGLIKSDEGALRRESEREIEAYRGRNVDPELRAIVEELKVTNPELGPYLGMDFGQLAPFIDRELTFAETLSPEEADRYNVLAELLGTNPVQRIAPEAGFNRESIIAALLAEAQNEQKEAKTFDEMFRQKTIEEDKKRREASRGSIGDVPIPDVPIIPEHKNRQYTPPAPKREEPGGIGGAIKRGFEWASGKTGWRL